MESPQSSADSDNNINIKECDSTTPTANAETDTECVTSTTTTTESNEAQYTIEEHPHEYVVPVKCVKTMADMAAWEKSHAYYDLLAFINEISQAIQGKTTSFEMELSPIVNNLLNIFEQLNEMLDATPPIDQPQRFGNKAYRDWYQKLKKQRYQLLQNALPEEYHRAICEIEIYFIESFGNATRIDYGTGHELSFIFFLCCLFKIGALSKVGDRIAVGIKVFYSYLKFVRKLQLTYRMEPAGSHGVWSLDDYQFIPFIWGSAQLAINSPFESSKFLDDKIIEKYKNEYLFIGCIDYIKQVKTGNFAEHSNQLWSITSVSTWTKINTGLCRMFVKEILGKFPVVQHILFGSLMSFKALHTGTLPMPPHFGVTMPPPPSSLLHRKPIVSDSGGSSKNI